MRITNVPTRPLRALVAAVVLLAAAPILALLIVAHAVAEGFKEAVDVAGEDFRDCREIWDAAKPYLLMRNP